MDPKKAQRLAKTSAMKEFIPILLKEVKKLDTVTDIDTTKVDITDPVKVAVEVKARKLAIEKIIDILKPLNIREVDSFNLKEYIV